MCGFKECNRFRSRLVVCVLAYHRRDGLLGRRRRGVINKIINTSSV